MKNLGVTGAFSPAGRGFFTFGVLIIKTRRLVSAFLLVRAPVPRSNTVTGLVLLYCGTVIALIFIFNIIARFSSATTANLVIIYSGTAANFPLF